MHPLALRIAVAARRLFDAPLSPTQRARIETSAVDYVACLRAGGARPEAALALPLARCGEVAVPGVSGRFEPASVALVAGTVGALLQLHDAFPEGGNHPSSTVIPAILALREPSAAGLDWTMSALACGYEVANRLALAGYPEQQRAGLTPTAIAGAIGAAVAGGLMLDLGTAALARAVGLATLTAPATPFIALRSHAEATPLHGGLAARAGVEAVLLARAGADAGDRALDGDDDTPGWLAAMRLAPERLEPEAWDGSTLDAVVWKLYPSCLASHLSIEAVLAAPPIDVEQIDRVEIGLADAALTLVSRGPDTDALYDRLMSVRWSVAEALIHRRMDLATAGHAPAPLIARIETFADAELASLPRGDVGGRVRITLRSGGVLDLHRRRGLRDPASPGDPRGSASDPGDPALKLKHKALAPGVPRRTLLAPFTPE